KDDQFFSVRVAYQCPVKVNLSAESKTEEVFSNTFEDALVFENISMFKDLQGSGLIKKFNDAIKSAKSSADLGLAMFENLKIGKKAEFALEMLDLQGPNQLNVPTYIKEGLSWLQEQVRIKQKEVFIPVENSVLEGKGEHR
ncbi:MAG: hypothetical protein Q7T83_04485, partial [Thermodesulfovibrionales bacterium]|nr:hypothetical protein [Thermodesulfovibrionales bacterium]